MQPTLSGQGLLGVGGRGCLRLAGVAGECRPAQGGEVGAVAACGPAAVDHESVGVGAAHPLDGEGHGQDTGVEAG